MPEGTRSFALSGRGASCSPSCFRSALLDQRGRVLRAALGFATCSMPSCDRALHALRSYLDSWAGIGAVTIGMARQGFDLQLTPYDERGWRAMSS
jgi:hypothetical protein